MVCGRAAHTDLQADRVRVAAIVEFERSHDKQDNEQILT
jgi:hypothetical protein